MRLVVEKEGPDAAYPSLRRIDCFLLTTDLDYQPDLRDFGRQIYARTRLEQSTPPLFKVLEAVQTNGGTRTAPLPPLKAGEVTPWRNITRLFAGASEGSYVVIDSPKLTSSAFVTDFATGPSERAILKSVHYGGPGAGLVAWFPATSGPTAPPRTPEELATDRASHVSRLPPIPFGRRPLKFPILTYFKVPRDAWAKEAQVLAYVGINGHDGVLTDEDLANGFVFSRLYQTAYLPGTPPHIRPDYSAVERQVRVNVASLPSGTRMDRVLHVMLMDEAAPATLEKLAASEEAQSAFKSWLKEQRYSPFAPADLVDLARRHVRPNDAMRLVTSRDAPYPGLYFASQRFRAWSIVDYFHHVTDLAHAAYPPGVATTQTISDGPVYLGNFYAQGNDYFDYFSGSALDVALSEDWTNIGATHELCGWNVALLRAATRERGQPIHMNVIATSQRGPFVVKLKAATEIAEGATALLLYNYNPRYAVPQEPGWAEKPEMMPALAELTHEIGAVEDLLVGAKPTPAETAILYSIPADIWTTQFDTGANFERMATYLALRHAQVPVDVLSDEQARGKLLSRYKVVFFPNEQLDRRSAEPLARWVQGGGTLVLGPGAGLRDEWNRPTRALDQHLQLSRGPAEMLQKFHGATRSYCEAARTFGTVRFAAPSTAPPVNDEVNVLGWRSALSPSHDAAVLAEFAQGGAPAVLELRRGRGRVVLTGFLAGLSYLCGAQRAFSANDHAEAMAPVRVVAQAMAALRAGNQAADVIREQRDQAYGELPYRYDAALRALIVEPALSAGVSRPVTVQPAQVEATLLQGPRGWVVPLANYTGAPLERITVEIHAPRPHGAVRSARGGELPSESLPGGGVRVTLPLESTDYLAAEWR